MKVIALFAISVLIISCTSNVYAQNDPFILLDIATKANKQILNQLDRVYGDSIPSEINQLYNKGHAAVLSLEDSLPDDVEQSKENFLTAMKAFKQITRMLSVSTSEPNNADMNNRDLESKLNRLQNYFQSMKAISEKHDTGLDLSEIERLFAQAYEQINSNDLPAAAQTTQELKLLVKECKENIHSHESHSTTDRSKNFALKQLENIKITLKSAESADIPELEQANSLVAEIEVLISEDKISDVKIKFSELIQLVKVIESQN